MYGVRPGRPPEKSVTFITYNGERLHVCNCATFKFDKTKETAEVNTIISLTSKQAGEVAEIVGFYPREGDVHYVEDIDKIRKIRKIVSSM